MDVWIVTAGESLGTLDSRNLRSMMLMRQLASRHHHTTLWTTTFDHQTKEFIGAGVPEQRLDDLRVVKLLHSPVAYRRNISLSRLLNHYQIGLSFRDLALRSTRPHIIVCSYPTIELAYEATRYGQRARVPVILDVRDLWPDIFLDIPVRVLAPFLRPLARLVLHPYFLLARKAFERADAVVGISREYRDFGLRKAGRAATRFDNVIELGRDDVAEVPTNFDEIAESPAVRGIHPSRRTVWFVGTFGHTYDLGTVIRVAPRFPDVQFVFTGDGVKSARWRKAAEGIQNVIFTGWVSGRVLDYLSSIASVGILAYAPGAPQSLPNKVFEYMAAGLPLLSSLTGEAELLIREHNLGLTYVAGDADSLARELSTLLENPEEMRRCGSRAQQTFRERFTSSVIYDRYVDLIETMADAKSDQDP